MRIDIAKVLVLVAVGIAGLGSACAAQRTFVATTGLDSNPCSLAAPCRSFAHAIGATDPNGEIVVLESGGYGRVTIDKSVSIVAPPGIYAGISVFPGANGIDVATAGVQVSLRGLTINGQGGQHGIRLDAAAALDVERCEIGHLTGSGIEVNASGARLGIKDSHVHDNGASGVDVTGDVAIRMEASRVERNGGIGVYLHEGPSGIVSGASIAGNASTGLRFEGAATVMSLAVSDSRFHANGGEAGIYVAGYAAGTLNFEASANVVSGNDVYGIYVAAPGGTTILATLRGNTVAHNGSSGIAASFGSTTVNVARNVVESNGNAGIVTGNGAVVNTYQNNVVRDNVGSDTLGAFNNVGGV
jgi:hypothetical protein